MSKLVEISLEPVDTLLMWFRPHALYVRNTDTIHFTKYAKEEEIEEALNHETIHQVLCILEGNKVSLIFDRVSDNLK